MKRHYFLAPAAVAFVAYLSSTFMFSVSETGTTGWYAALVKPSIAPPDWVFGVVWPVLYLLIALALLLYLDNPPGKPQRRDTLWLFGVNGVLNVIWGVVFFHSMGWAILVAASLSLTALMLAILFWPFSRLASVLLWPYVVWTAFATLLTYSFWLLN